jgi:hypothetical protein
VGTKNAAITRVCTKGRKEEFEEILTGYKNWNSMKLRMFQEYTEEYGKK